ncbi:SDR family NAD(P)-dependent oxidoreductase [Ruegeria litorea]|nr:type I polyketide synthase [Falsiruegeria litorea]MBT8168155.1 SDR family NAD(P)-dependent oxidoreductase [Falsiruegeria litorea]
MQSQTGSFGRPMTTSKHEYLNDDIAIVGMSVSVPGAASAAAFWENLRSGTESITVVDDEALLAAGERPDLLANPNYVRATAKLDDYDTFDADFFGFSPKEAAILDPQHRKFLETAWEAMEHAGHPPESIDGPIGVYGGCGMGSYFYFNICSNPGLVDDVGMFLLRHTGNDKDFLSTRVSHVFDLKGPSINLQTACSTSLVAVHYASQALRNGECDMALAGGVTIELPQGRGYLYKENEILSPDGHCHAFDHRAQGTVFGSGAGVVALRRAKDAVADGDHIWAIIKGSAINNDGAAKAGYLAPSVDGQAIAIKQALSAAKVEPDTIDYVECHGTGTYLGDPIEISALSEAYRESTQDVGYCRVGSVKTNIGHLDTAAGVAGLVKTALGLHHGEIPPSLGYEAPNPAIDFETSPFRVNDTLREWTSHKGPRRAAINALGVGGTNAHAILQEATDRGLSEESDFPFHILCISGRSKAALDANAQSLATYLRANPDVDLADASYTLKEGRRAFEKRRILVAETALEAAEMLEASDPRQVFTHEALGASPETVFMFPGGGAQYAGMARDLYETEPVFAEWMDRGLEHLQKQLDYDIRSIWLPEDDETQANAKLTQPSVQLPLIMIVEYALAQLWFSWGVHPTAMVGHSMGENTAACLAGVMRFEDCIDLILLRGRLFDTVPAGGMLSISLPLEDVQALIDDDIDIASVNAPRLTAVSGPQAALDRLAETLSAQDVDHQRIPIDIAAHSRMLDPILAEYRAFLKKIALDAPTIPVMSNRTGTALSDAQATDPEYWVSQLRNTVMFADCIKTLQAPNRVFLEVGPGKALSSLAQMSDGVNPAQVLSALRHPDQAISDDAYFFSVIGRLWACGVAADWPQIWGEAKRHRLPLPTYAFQRSRYFIEPGKQIAIEADSALARKDDQTQWGYRTAWRPRLAECDIDVDQELSEIAPMTWLIFEDDAHIAGPACERLSAVGHRVIRVSAGDTFAKLGDTQYQIAPEQGRHSYDQLLQELANAGDLPNRIGHFWLVTDQEIFRPGHSFYDRNMECGFLSLTALAQAMGSVEMPENVHIITFTTGAAQVFSEALPYPEKATIAGPLGVIPHEMPGVTCARVDIELPETPPTGLFAKLRSGTPAQTDTTTSRILEELLAEPSTSDAAWRGEKRYGHSYKPTLLSEEDPVFKDGGTYLITGGFGGIGLTLASDLMTRHHANVVLLSRDPLPPRDQWARYLASHSPVDRTASRIKALQNLEASNSGAVLAISADVCNSEQMRAALHTAEETFGALNGVIHGAGHIHDGPILTKTEAELQQVLAPKISGLRVLDEIFPDGMLELMVLFASSSTATHPAGQVDYVAANEYLNAWANSRKSGATRVIAVNWGVWSDVGMAAEAKDTRLDGNPPTERVASPLPLLDEAGFDPSGNRLFVSHLSADDHWVLDEHRTTNGDALLPGTGYVEFAAQALKAHGVDLPYAIRDLYFFRPLAVDRAKREIVVRLETTPTGYAFSVHSACRDGYELNAQAEVEILQPKQSEPLDLAAISATCPTTKTSPVDGYLQSPQERHLAFGPRWHVLRSFALGANEGLARLVLPDAYHSDLAEGYQLHPGLMDLATGWAISLAPGYDGTSLWVPVSYRAIQVFSPLPREIRSWVRLSEGSAAVDGFVSFDVTLSDPNGQICVEIEGFQMQATTGTIDLSPAAAPDADAVALGLEAHSSDAPLSPEEQRLHHNISQGIRREEGPEALRRALNTGLSQVYVSSMDLSDLIKQADRISAPSAGDAQSFERPDLDTNYVAPRNDTEKTLAGFFETLLGVTQVGVEDSFFDLGGHSLIAVRLFAQINRTFDVEFPISLLFEAPNVARIAERIGHREDAANEDKAPEAKTDFKHVVPLHIAKDSQATPFFIVAGMFGNVLNLRHLALMLGRERSVYGLQARGLIGQDKAHDTLVEAAADYIAELRQVQPHGPYLLGGFSGGGLTAYEMVHQLEEAGEEVALLAMLDTPLPVRPTLSKRDKALIKVSELRKKGPAFLTEWAGNRIAWELQKRQSERPQTAITSFNNTKIESAFYQAISVYSLRPWSGPLVLFRPPLDKHWKVSGGRWVSQQREYVFEDNEWTQWAPKTRVVEVPGDHDSMVLVPNVAVLAEHLKGFIDEAETVPRAYSKVAE